MSAYGRLYLDVHVLQTVPASCVNRDDTGSPKTALYGGVTRARVSSQSWKRSMRVMFRELFPQEKLGVRTKRIVDMVAQHIHQRNVVQDAQSAAIKLLEAAGIRIDKDGKTDALFFLSWSQAKALVDILEQDPDLVKRKVSKADAEKTSLALKEYPAIDVSLFGRMVASDPSLNTDACAQVAHSLSTHKVTTEYDYFTAVDDQAPEDNVGAGHIGTVEFNSSTLYRYATLAVHQLTEHLGDDAVLTAVEFVRAFVLSMPTGKQNTFANRTLPDAVLVTIRHDQPVNLVGAFEKPVPASDEGYVVPSAKRLVHHARSAYQQFAGEPDVSLVTGELLYELGEVSSFPQLLNNLHDKLADHLQVGQVGRSEA